MRPGRHHQPLRTLSTSRDPCPSATRWGSGLHAIPGGGIVDLLVLISWTYQVATAHFFADAAARAGGGLTECTKEPPTGGGPGRCQSGVVVHSATVAHGKLDPVPAAKTAGGRRIIIAAATPLIRPPWSSIPGTAIISSESSANRRKTAKAHVRTTVRRSLARCSELPTPSEVTTP